MSDVTVLGAVAGVFACGYILLTVATVLIVRDVWVLVHRQDSE